MKALPFFSLSYCKPWTMVQPKMFQTLVQPITYKEKYFESHTYISKALVPLPFQRFPRFPATEMCEIASASGVR